MRRRGGIFYAFAVLLLLPIFCPLKAWGGNDDKSGVRPQVISLPKGPGSIEGLGESFTPQLNNGSAVYTIPIKVPPGVAGFQPDLKLTYNSGRGSGIFGVGWDINIPSIQRQTDKGLPQYSSSDTFIYGEGEEILPLSDGITYRLKNEGEFLRFQRNGDSWEVTDKSGTQYIFGGDSNSRIYSGTKIFKWYLGQAKDTNGNQITYTYTRDSGQLYLSEIRYSVFGTSYHSVKFLYEARPDTIMDYRSTFKVSTNLRCSGVEVRTQGGLVRKYKFSYNIASFFSLLENVTLVGGDNKTLYPAIMTFGYTGLAPTDTMLREITSPPARDLTDPNCELMDVNGDGLPDILYTDAVNGNHKYYLNHKGEAWEGERTMSGSPSFYLQAPGTQLADIDADGLSDLLVKPDASSPARYFPSTGQGGWKTDVPFLGNIPNFGFEDPNVRLVDLNHDSFIDVMLTQNDFYFYWFNQNGVSFSDPMVTSSVVPGLTFGNSNLQLADMNGDRLLDLVQITSTFIRFWPSMGFGLWDAPIMMDTSAITNLPDIYSQLRLVDVNSDGISDLLYVGASTVDWWINLGNGSFAWAVHVTNTPLVDANTAVRMADMNGNGSVDVLWTKNNRYFYLDLSNGVASNLLSKIENGLGRTTNISYQTTGYFLFKDQDDGAPWPDMVPIPVPVVSKVEVADGLGNFYPTDYIYHNGFYDGKEHEFRGFGLVEVLEGGDSTSPPLVTKNWFDTGKNQECLSGKVLKIDQATLAALSDLSDDHNTLDAHLFKRIINTWQLRQLFPAEAPDINFPYLSAKDTSIGELLTDTSQHRSLSVNYSYDDFGNLTQESNLGDTSITGDELTTEYTFALNPGLWIMDKPCQISKQDGTGAQLEATRNYYDGPAFEGLGLCAPPVKGLLTRAEVWEGSTAGAFFTQESREFDAYGNPTVIRDGNGNNREIVYDNVLHTYPLSENIHPQPGKTLKMQASYDLGFGIPISFTDPNNNTTLFKYDIFGRLGQIIKPGDSSSLPTVQYIYNLADPISSIESRTREISGRSETFDQITYHDGLGRKLETIEEGEKTGQYVLKEAVAFNQRQTAKYEFNPIFLTSMNYYPSQTSDSHLTKYYDEIGRIAKIVNADSSIARTVYQPQQKQEYDEEDNNPLSSHFNTPHQFLYNGLDQLVEVREQNGVDQYITQYQWDPRGHITQITDALSNVKTIAYDGLGRMKEMWDPDAGHWQYAYDNMDNLVKVTDARGWVTSYKYDGANRRTGINYITQGGDTADDVKYHYDSASAAQPGMANLEGRISWVQDQSGGEFYGYDARGNIIKKIKSVGDVNYSFAYTYDAMDRRTSTTYPDQFRITYQYNPRSLLESISNVVDAIDYNAMGQRENVLFHNGIQTAFAYDLRHRLLTLKTQNSLNGDPALQDYQYLYDQSGNITEILDNRSVIPEKSIAQTFQYDDLYRLTRADGAYGWVQYGYNALGSMIQKNSSLAELDLGTLGYGSAAGPHAVTSVKGENYLYDANGNLASKPGSSYEFDFENRLTRILEGAIESARFEYDFDGQRVTKHSSLENVIYVDGEFEVRDGVPVKNVFVGNLLVAQIRPKNSTQAALSSSPSAASLSRMNYPGPAIFFAIFLAIIALFVNAIPVQKPSAQTSSRALKLALVCVAFFLSTLPFGCGKKGGGGGGDDNGGQAVPQQYLFIHTDHLGSVNVMTDQDGLEVFQQNQFPFGETRYQSGTPKTPYSFTGKEKDGESGYYYFGTRFMDASIGSFISADLAMANEFKNFLEKPQYLNIYAYGLNNPIGFIDATGKVPEPFSAKALVGFNFPYQPWDLKAPRGIECKLIWTYLVFQSVYPVWKYLPYDIFRVYAQFTGIWNNGVILAAAEKQLGGTISVKAGDITQEDLATAAKTGIPIGALFKMKENTHIISVYTNKLTFNPLFIPKDKVLGKSDIDAILRSEEANTKVHPSGEGDSQSIIERWIFVPNTNKAVERK